MKAFTSLFAAILILLCSQTSFAKVRFVAEGNTEIKYSNDAHYLTYVRYMTVPFANQTGSVWTTGTDVVAIKALETDPVQRQIFQQMEAATEWFAFSNVAHALGRVKQRLEAIGKMNDFNTIGGFSYADRSKGVPVKTDATHWDPGINTDFYFVQKSGTAYEAINELCNPTVKTYGECLGAMIACVWWGSSQGMGEVAFNTLYPITTSLDMDSRNNNTSQLNTARSIDASHVVPGDWGYWENYNYNSVLRAGYSKSDPRRTFFFDKGWLKPASKKTYFWSGENAFFLGRDTANDPRYGGLGANVWNKTNTQMREELRASYNADFQDVIQGIKTLPIDATHTSAEVYNGLEIKEITAAAALDKIKFVYVDRLRF